MRPSIATGLVLLIILAASFAQAKDVVFFFYGGDAQQQILRTDSIVNKVSSLGFKNWIESDYPELEVDVRPVKTFSEASAILKAETRVIRGIVYQGHGSADRMSLSKRENIRGYDLSNQLASALWHANLSDKLTIYLSGCSLAAESDGFAARFSMTLSEALLHVDRPVKLEVVAHEIPVRPASWIKNESRLYRLLKFEWMPEVLSDFADRYDRKRNAVLYESDRYPVGRNYARRLLTNSLTRSNAAQRPGEACASLFSGE